MYRQYRGTLLEIMFSMFNLLQSARPFLCVRYLRSKVMLNSSSWSSAVIVSFQKIQCQLERYSMGGLKIFSTTFSLLSSDVVNPQQILCSRAVSWTNILFQRLRTTSTLSIHSSLCQAADDTYWYATITLLRRISL